MMNFIASVVRKLKKVRIMSKTYDIQVLVHREKEAIKALEKIAKKANKYGNDVITYERGEEIEIDYHYEALVDMVAIPKIIKMKAVTYHVTGQAPKIEGYTFLAKIEPLSDNKNLLHRVPDLDDTIKVDDKFKTTKMHCEHCNVNRYRKDVYVLQNDKTQEQIQVGRTCLRDYLGVDTPEAVLSAFRYIAEVRDMTETYRSHGHEVVASQEDILTFACAEIRQNGYIRTRDEGVSTAQLIGSCFHESNKPEIRAIISSVTEKDKEKARAIIEYFTNIDASGNDYLYNLQSLILADCITMYKHFNILVSGVVAYDRAQGKIVEKENKPKRLNEHFGNRGEKIKVEGAQIVHYDIKDGHYGQFAIVKMLDVKGRMFTTFTTSDKINWSEYQHDKKPFNFTAKVKDFNEYQGRKETVVTHVKEV